VTQREAQVEQDSVVDHDRQGSKPAIEIRAMPAAYR
jgi:hypothetical protein